MIVRLGIMTFVKYQVVALDGSRFNPSSRMLIAVKLVDVMVIPLAQSTPDTAFPLKEDPATVVNKVPIFSLISDRCDIFVACPVTVKPSSAGVAEGVSQRGKRRFSDVDVERARLLHQHALHRSRPFTAGGPTTSRRSDQPRPRFA